MVRWQTPATELVEISFVLWFTDRKKTSSQLCTDKHSKSFILLHLITIESNDHINRIPHAFLAWSLVYLEITFLWNLQYSEVFPFFKTNFMFYYFLSISHFTRQFTLSTKMLSSFDRTMKIYLSSDHFLHFFLPSSPYFSVSICFYSLLLSFHTLPLSVQPYPEVERAKRSLEEKGFMGQDELQVEVEVEEDLRL